MRLFGLLHLTLLAGTVAVATGLSVLCRRRPRTARTVRLTLGWGLMANELAWYAFRYSHEGVHLRNLPLQLCDLTVWLSVVACLTALPRVVEFAYFAGLAGAGMALLTPDLWSPWPSYPAIYFFAAHGGIVTAVAVMVFGGICPLAAGAVWRAYGLLLCWAAVVGGFNYLAGSNYMYLCRKPSSASALDMLGPWPVYLLTAAVAALALFWLLWLPARGAGRHDFPT
jgi:hypothetical integral membrane protein (TIGR02206 family)